jgi:proline utilization trans-activator
MSSSHAFSSKVQDLLMKSRLNRQTDSQSSSSRLVSTDTATSLFGPPTRAEQRLPQLPPEKEAHRLFEIVNLYIGQTQNHYDPRELSDRMGLLYGSGNDTIQTHDLWCMEIIIILAIGKMLAAEFDDEGAFPGVKLFEFAYQNFPPLSVHYSQGRLGVETHALMAMYLQMANRKEEAYLYVSVTELSDKLQSSDTARGN